MSCVSRNVDPDHVEPLCLRKITIDSHILVHLECTDDTYWKLDIFNLRTDIRWLRTHTSSARNNAVHDFTLLGLIVARFVGTVFFKKML